MLDIFVGSSFLIRSDSNYLFKTLLLFLNNLGLNANNLHVVMSHIGRISLFESGVLSQNIYSYKGMMNKYNHSFLYLCGVDLDRFCDLILKKSQFIVFQGNFFSQRLYDNVDLILPSTIYTEGVFHYLT